MIRVVMVVVGVVLGIAVMLLAPSTGEAGWTDDVKELRMQAKLNNRAVQDLRLEIEALRLQRLEAQSRVAEGTVMEAGTVSGTEDMTVVAVTTPEPEIPAGTLLETILADESQRSALRDQVFSWYDQKRKRDARQELENYLRMLQNQQNQKLLKQLKLTEEQKDPWKEIMAEFTKESADLRSEKYAALDNDLPRESVKEINKKLLQAVKEKNKKLKALLTPEQAKSFGKTLRQDSKDLQDPALKLLQQQAQ